MFPRTATERRIAVGRLTLSVFTLLGLWLEPTEPQQYAGFARALVAAYVLYSMVMAGLTWRSRAPLGRARLIHSADLLAVSGLLAAVDRPTYLVLPLLVYAFLSGSLRWQWRGTQLTGALLLVVTVVIGLCRALTDPGLFQLEGIVVRCLALVAIAVLTGRLGALEARVRRQMQQLATPPDVEAMNTDELVGSMLEWAAGITGAPRMLLAWGEAKEPWLELVLWDRGEYRRMREPSDAFNPLVAVGLEHADFLHEGSAGCLVGFPGGFRPWTGEPLGTRLRERFSIGSVLAIAMTGEEVTGRLFFLDKVRMTSDDLVLGEIIAHTLADRLRALRLARCLSAAALAEERLRLGRDLHDGAFHLLTGMAFEVERLLRKPEPTSSDTRDLLQQVQRSLEEEQRTLRILIEGLRTSTETRGPDMGPETRLKEVVSRIQRQWGLNVDVRADDLAHVPMDWWAEICLLVNEALVNAGRHAGASSCMLEIVVKDGQVSIVVADDGRGFSLKGHYDHGQLAILGLGPSTLRERAALLGGTVTLDSTDTGSRVEILLPLARGGRTR